MSGENEPIRINNKFISNVITLLVGFILLWIVGFVLVNKWIKSTEKRYKLPLLLCYFGIAVVLGAILLLPVTILSHGLLHSLPDNVYLMWLDGDVIYALWQGIFMGTNICLFIILPFAYFYHETEDFHFGTSYEGGEMQIVYKFRSALINLMLLAITFGGTVYILREILYGFAKFQSPFFQFSHSLITLTGSFLVLACIPTGFAHMTLWPWIRNIRDVNAFFFEEEWRREKEALEMEQSYLVRKLTRRQDVMDSDFMKKMRKDLEINCRFFERDESRDDVARQLLSTELKLADHEKMALPKFQILKRTILKTFWHLVSMIYHIMNLVFPGLIVLKTASGLFVNLTVGPEQTVLNFLNPSAGSYIGLISTIIDMCVVMYIIIASFVGYFNVSLLKRLYSSKKGDRQSLTVIQLIFNTFLVLIISSSIPVSAKILGLIRFDLLADFESFNRIKNTKFIAVYKLLFMTALVKRIIEMFPVVKWIRYVYDMCKMLKEKFVLWRETTARR